MTRAPSTLSTSSILQRNWFFEIVPSRESGSGFLVDVEHLVPALPAVRRAQHSAIFAWTERAAEHGGEGDVGVPGVDDDRADLSLGLPHVLPALTAIGRTVDAVAFADVATNVGFT